MASDDQQQDQVRERPAHRHEEHYHSEIARLTTTMYVGVLALMTFMLTVGVQRPHAVFSYALYSSIATLSLSLLCYALVHGMGMMDWRAKGGKSAAAERWRGVLRTAQQVFFVVAIIAVAWLAFEAARFFFAIPATPSLPPQ